MVIHGDLLKKLQVTSGLSNPLAPEIDGLGPGTHARYAGKEFDLSTVVAAMAHGWEPSLRGGDPPNRLTMGPVQKTQTALGSHEPLC